MKGRYLVGIIHGGIYWGVGEGFVHREHNILSPTHSSEEIADDGNAGSDCHMLIIADNRYKLWYCLLING